MNRITDDENDYKEIKNAFNSLSYATTYFLDDYRNRLINSMAMKGYEPIHPSDLYFKMKELKEIIEELGVLTNKIKEYID